MYWRFLRMVNATSLLIVGGTAGLLVAQYDLAKVVAAGLVALYLLSLRGRGRNTEYGSAEFAKPFHLTRELGGGNGMSVGRLLGSKITRLDGLLRLFDPRWPASYALPWYLKSCQRNQVLDVKLNDAVHTLIVAPSGAGKNVALLSGFLLSCPDGMVILDPKGENARLTAEIRRKEFGHKIVMLDPFGVMGRPSDTLNVMHGIDPADPHAFDSLKAIAATFFERDAKNGGDPFWSEGAQDASFMVMAFVAAHMPDGVRNLQTVRGILASEARFKQAAEAATNSAAYEGMLKRLAEQFVGMNPKELSSFRSVANRSLGVLDTPLVARNTSSSTFDPSEIMTGKTTAYLILPPEYLNSHGKILKLWVGAFLRACVRNGPQEHTLVRFILDEVAVCLGRMPELEDLVQVYRGYGVRATFVVQNLAMVSRIMPEGQEATLLGNCCQVYFGITDHKTAKEISDTIGKFTQYVTGGNAGWSRSDASGKEGGSGGNYSTSGGESWQLAARELLTADEIMRADPSVAITIAPGKPPILTRLVRYYQPEFRNTGRIGPVRAAFDTACLLLAALVVGATNLAAYLMR